MRNKITLFGLAPFFRAKYLSAIPSGMCAIVLIACVDFYPPPISNREANFIVIEEFLNSGDSSIVVKITRTVPLTGTVAVPVERGANVVLEDDRGLAVGISETNGNYSAARLPIDISRQYRLHIRIKSGEEYLSDFITLKTSPPIDSILWETNSEGIRILVNTHDDTDQSRYYRWELVETWEYHARFESFYKAMANQVVPRTPEEYVSTCWMSRPTQNILMATSSRLSRDVISRFPLTLLEKGSEKLYHRYSLLVRQYAITRETYDYWSLVKKVSESLGGMYDVQPGQVKGNFHNVKDPADNVVGYFDGGQPREKRFFLRYAELPDGYRFIKPRDACEIYSLAVGTVLSRSGIAILTPLYSPTGIIVGYDVTYDVCGNCLAAGGVNIKPGYWP